MPKIGFRKFAFRKDAEAVVSQVAEELRESLEARPLLQECEISVYHGIQSCCGVVPTDLCIQIRGREALGIKDTDIAIFSRILQICEEMGVTKKCEQLMII